MSKKARIIVDVTQLAHWSGHITGIPRVIDEMAKGFYGLQDHDVVFAVWVKDLQELCEIDYVQTIVEHKGLVYKTGESDAEQQSAEAAPEQPATTSSSRVYGKTLIKRAVKKGLRVSGRFSPRVANKLEAQAKQMHMRSYRKVVFRKDDRLFIPWGEWWDQTFTDRVVRAHKEQGVRIVQVIHDVAPTVWPQFFEQVAVSPTVYNSQVVPIADLVMAVSENTKRELTQWLKSQKLHVPRIEVFRLGDSVAIRKPEKPTEEAFVKSGLKGNDFILCVGTIEAKKNHYLFYYVYKLAKQRGVKLPKLVIIGRHGFHTDDMYDIMSRDPEVKDDFVFLHDATDENVSWAYDHCLFTVLASFHEGWGIPIAESVARGVPCLCSNTSSMVEIAEGKGVEHFSPTSSEECFEGIMRWLDPKKLEAARKKAQSYKLSTWAEAFDQVKMQMEKINDKR